MSAARHSLCLTSALTGYDYQNCQKKSRPGLIFVAVFSLQPYKPLFVTMMVYLNPEWTEDLQAETLVMDKKTKTGIFVQPAPGRVLLMDQDAPHRISASAKHAQLPRYVFLRIRTEDSYLLFNLAPGPPGDL